MDSRSRAAADAGFPRLREITTGPQLLEEEAFRKASLGRCARRLHIDALPSLARSSASSCAAVRCFVPEAKKMPRCQTVLGSLHGAADGSTAIRPSTSAFAPCTMEWWRPCADAAFALPHESRVRRNVQMTKHDRPLPASTGDEAQESKIQYPHCRCDSATQHDTAMCRKSGALMCRG